MYDNVRALFGASAADDESVKERGLHSAYMSLIERDDHLSVVSISQSFQKRKLAQDRVLKSFD